MLHFGRTFHLLIAKPSIDFDGPHAVQKTIRTLPNSFKRAGREIVHSLYLVGLNNIRKLHKDGRQQLWYGER